LKRRIDEHQAGKRGGNASNLSIGKKDGEGRKILGSKMGGELEGVNDQLGDRGEMEVGKKERIKC